MHLHWDRDESTCQTQNPSLHTLHLSEEHGGLAPGPRLLHWLVLAHANAVPGAGGGANEAQAVSMKAVVYASSLVMMFTGSPCAAKAAVSE